MQLSHIEDQAGQVEQEIKTSQMTDDRMKVGDMSEAVLGTLAPAAILLQPLQITREAGRRTIQLSPGQRHTQTKQLC